MAQRNQLNNTFLRSNMNDETNIDKLRTLAVEARLPIELTASTANLEKLAGVIDLFVGANKMVAAQRPFQQAVGSPAEARAALAALGGANTAQAPVGAEIAVTDDMVRAYLIANRDYWHKADELPPRLGTWREGTPFEAARVSMTAALKLAAQPATPAAPGAERLVRMVIDDMNVCVGEAGAAYRFTELSQETTEALKAWSAAPQPERVPMTREQVDAAFDQYNEAPTMEFRYLVTQGIEQHHGIGSATQGAAE